MIDETAFNEALTAMEGERFKRVDAGASDEENRAAGAHNMRLLGLYSAAQKALLHNIETAFPDRSVGAIWRRAYKRSIHHGNAAKSRRWKAKAIGLNPDPLHNAIALSGMAPLQVDEKWMVAVAIPQPRPSNDPYPDIQDVVLIDPTTNKASVLGDAGATHIAPPIGMVDRLPVMTDPKAWARHIALDRLEWWHLQRKREKAIQAPAVWSGWPTAALLLTTPKKMRWSDLSASVLEVPADMRETVRRAVLAEARLPRIEGRA